MSHGTRSMSSASLPEVYRAVVREEISPDVFREIVQSLVAGARKGQRWAIRDSVVLVVSMAAAGGDEQSGAGRVIVLRGGQADSVADVVRRAEAEQA